MKKFSLLGILLIGFMLEGCSYSSPKEAYDVNIVGKNALQKTNSTTSRRYPDGNKITEKNSESKNSESLSLKKNDSNYDTYQHYQSNKPPKKAKRRPILNLKELNDLMDREATITLTERRTKNGEQPKIDADSNIQKVIEYNKNKNRSNTKKRVKVLVVKKEETPVNETFAKAAPVIAASSSNSSEKKSTAKKIAPTTTTNNSPTIPAISSKDIKATNNKNLSLETPKIPEPNVAIPTTKPKNNNTSAIKPKAQKTTVVAKSKVSTTAAPNPAVNTKTLDVTMPKPETSITAVDIKTPEVTMPELDSPNSAVNTNTSDTIIPAPVKSIAVSNSMLDAIPEDNSTTVMSPVDLSTDTSDMTQKELEQHLKAKFDTEVPSDQDLMDEETTNSQMDDIDSFDPNIPLPAIPSATSFSSTLSSLNELFITYYYKAKLSIMSLIGSWFGIDW